MPARRRSATENKVPLWGMRGAGQKFGVATQIEYHLHALSKVYGGPLFYPLSAEIMRIDDALRSHADQAVYVNALDDGAAEGEGRVREAHGANYARLKTLKESVDPTNFFCRNSNIKPSHTTRGNPRH